MLFSIAEKIMAVRKRVHRGIDRRNFLRGTAQTLGAAAIAAPFQALLAREAAGQSIRSGPGYGELIEMPDEATGLPLLKLPRGFRYRTLGWTGDPLTEGGLTPPMHDGMAVVESMYGRVVLVRNHELSNDGDSFADGRITYDPQGPGGTTNVIFNCESGVVERTWASISGTVRNCAGGPTPWGSWLTCEETVSGPGDKTADEPIRDLKLEQTHGWIFEVPASRAAVPMPIKEMGRFVHEAVAVDPDTGYVYETEDKATSGFYRFVPKQYGWLHLGGKLQMLKLKERDDLRKGLYAGEVFKVEWVTIDDPTLPHSSGTDGLGVFMQGKQRGGATFDRLEGCWYHGGLIYFVSTSGGDAGAGQVWEYNPRREQLRLIFESPSAEVLDHPDNMTVSPRGGILLCEDGGRNGQFMQGLTLAGEVFPFAQNNVVLHGQKNDISGDFRTDEWAGATFSPDGKWLFANLQSPGITVAITGPWAEGVL